MGGGLVHLLLGGPTIAGATLSRFFALHVFVIPGTLLFLALRARVDGAQAGHQ
jgi:ubiquinol-cytochrome c reductase cytochrome b subunit